jgi:hypothetical protein
MSTTDDTGPAAAEGVGPAPYALDDPISCAQLSFDAGMAFAATCIDIHADGSVLLNKRDVAKLRAILSAVPEVLIALADRRAGGAS